MLAMVSIDDLGRLVFSWARALIFLISLAMGLWFILRIWAKISVDDVGGLVSDAAKVMIGLIGLAAGLWFTLGISRSNGITWFFLMGPVTAMLAAIGTKFPPRRPSVAVLGLLLTMFFGVGAALWPALAAIRAVAETRPPLWRAFSVGLAGYLIGGGLVLGLFLIVPPKGIDLMAFFFPLLAAFWGVAGGLYIMAYNRMPPKPI